jgi:hypothetical protein
MVWKADSKEFYFYLFRREWLWYGKLIVKEDYNRIHYINTMYQTVKNSIYSNGDLDL